MKTLSNLDHKIGVPISRYVCQEKKRVCHMLWPHVKINDGLRFPTSERLNLFVVPSFDEEVTAGFIHDEQSRGDPTTKLGLDRSHSRERLVE